jgi:hypothetical protein
MVWATETVTELQGIEEVGGGGGPTGGRRRGEGTTITTGSRWTRTEERGIEGRG